jgi:hypothetical protein
MAWKKNGWSIQARNVIGKGFSKTHVRDAFLKHALMLLLSCWPLCAATPPRWESNIEKRYGFKSFDRAIRAVWMKQQGLVYLTPERLLIYQVNPASARVKLAPRGSSGGAGNFLLILKVLDARDGSVLHSLQLTTSGETSRVLATHSGGFVVQAGAAVYVYSPGFEQTAARSLPAERAAPVENWQMQVSPSGEKLVLMHEQVFIPAELLADNTVIHDGRAKVEMQILDSASLQPQANFGLEHTLAFWTPGEEYLFSSNPEHSYSDGKLGILDFSGSWSAIRSDLPKEQHFCRYGITVLNNAAQRAVFFGCDSFSVFSSAGKALFSGTGPGCFFSSAAAAGPYLALQCDSYSAERLTQRSLMVSPPRADRLEVYDADSHAHRLSVRVHGERVYYALSGQGELAVVNGARLRVFGVERVSKSGAYQSLACRRGELAKPKEPRWLRTTSGLSALPFLNMHGPYGEPAACHLDRQRRSEATEEEWRDREDACATLLIQGVLTECHSPEPHYTTAIGGCKTKRCSAVRRACRPSSAFTSRGGRRGNSMRSLGRTPRIGIAEDAFPGSLHSSSVASSVGVGRDDSASGSQVEN